MLKLTNLYFFLLLVLPVISAEAFGSGPIKQEITFQSGGATLSGTLLMPKGKGPFPAFVFAHGSGEETRENNLSRAKEFVKQGYAALIYDKRGTGESSGNKDFPQYFTFDTLAMDAIAALEFLQQQPLINTNKLGLVASSQSGWIAPIVASKFKTLAMMIVISGSVSTVGEDNIFERNARLKMEGFTEEDIKEVTEMHLVDIEVSRSGKDFERFQEMWNTYQTRSWFKRVYIGSSPMSTDSKYRKWYRSVVDFDPTPLLATITTPILWMYGDPMLDRFCPVDLSVERLQKLIANGSKFTIKTIDGASHSLFIKSRDMFVQDVVFDWIKKH